MSWLEKIEDTFVKAKPRIIVYGEEGIGKTTFASMAPNPIFVSTENGTRNIKSKCFSGIKTFSDVLGCVTELATAEHDFKTICIDTLDWLEPMVWKHVCDKDGVSSIYKASGGFNRGFDTAVDYWKELTAGLDYLSLERQMYVILTAHRTVREVKAVDSDKYDKLQLKLNDKANSYLFEWADIVMYAKRKMYVTKTDTGNRIAVASGSNGGDRVLQTIGIPSCMGKNRFNLPEEIPLDWNEFEKALNANN